MNLIKILSNLNGREVIALLGVILLSVLIWHFFLRPKLKKVVKKIKPSKINDGTSFTDISDVRKVYLRDLASDLYSNLSSWSEPSLGHYHTKQNLTSINALNDAELTYLNKAYSEISDKTLYHDVDNDLIGGSQDDDLLARLLALNLSEK